MQITKDDLDAAAAQGILSAEQSDALWNALSQRTAGRAKFDAAHVAWYFGAFVILGAMGWFMTEGWDSLGGGGIAAIAAIYAILFTIGGHYAWDKYQLRVPGGLLFTIAVWMTPIVIYGIERVTGMWPAGDPGSYRDYHIWVRGSWILMELGTIVAGVIALRLRRFPFLTFPIAFALWYMSMDLTPLIAGATEFTWDERAWVSVGFGAIVIVVAWLVDRRDHDYAFWCYFFGLLAFWGGLTSLNGDNEWAKFTYFAINVALIALSLYLKRRVFLVFGALGSFLYLGHLAWTVFRDSILFPFVLTLGGLGIIAIGMLILRRQTPVKAP
ncbi:MAG TPA: DUF2157 domain-containing protein [Thermoanaerobaculia bacterium]|nr:DUF2157 domain-containing protein [Thermoanaerobaculia bacterium]